MLTQAQPDRFRAKEARDKIAVRRILIGLPILAVCLFGFVAADTWHAAPQTTLARAVSMSDTSSLRHGQRCLTILSTDFGEARVTSAGLCRQARWHVGSEDTVQAQKFHISRAVIVDPPPFGVSRRATCPAAFTLMDATPTLRRLAPARPSGIEGNSFLPPGP